MNKVPQHLIDEATKRGIVPGARVTDAYGDIATVLPHSEWEYEKANEDMPGAIGERIIIKPNCYVLSNVRGWGTVITPAPSQGLKDGDCVTGSESMLTAIAELALELGLAEGRHMPSYRSENRGLTWRPEYGCRLQCGVWGEVIPPEIFIAKMRLTASQPKPIRVGEWKVKFGSGEITVGCTTIDNATVRAIAEKLKD